MSDIRLDFRNAFSTESGQRVLEHILHQAYADREFPMGEGALDSHKLAMAEGARRLALKIKRSYDEGCRLGNDETRQATAVRSLTEDGSG